MSDKVSNASDEHYSAATRVQLTGTLFKKSFGQHSSSSKWAKRFFVLKDGYLLYYSESEKKAFEKKPRFNMHPRGAVPLGGCVVESLTSEPGHPYALVIRNDDCGLIVLAAETQYEQERWLRVLQEATRITWQNTQMGEVIIRELENQGLQLNKERHNYLEKLQEETQALTSQISRNEELKRVNELLAAEKNHLEEAMEEVRMEQEALKGELSETARAAMRIEEDREALRSAKEALQQTLEQLQDDKTRLLEALQSSSPPPQGNEERKGNSLQEQLRDLDEEARILREDQLELQKRLEENEKRAQIVAEERELMTKQSTELGSTLNDLMMEKELAEEELQEEVVAQVHAEWRLEAAETSLQRLHGSLSSRHVNPEFRDAVLPDVNKLKRFFEQVAEEARIQARLPIIMKNAICARKALAKKVRSQKIEATRQEHAKSLGLELELAAVGTAGAAGSSLKRSLSTYIASSKSWQPEPQSLLRRTRSTRSYSGSTGRTSNDQEPSRMMVVDGEMVSLRHSLTPLSESTLE